MVILALALAAPALLAACADDEGQAQQDQQIADLEAQAGRLEMQVQQLQANLEAASTQAETAIAALMASMDGPDVGPVLRVMPAIYNMPQRQTGYGNVWFYGSGLEPGQWYTISVRADDGEQEVPLLGNPDNVRQANEVGAFAISLTRLDAREGRFDYAGLGPAQLSRGGVFILSLENVDTGEILASTPWVVCGQARENPWCSAAMDTAILPAEEPEE